MTQKSESTQRIDHVQGANPPRRHEAIGPEIPPASSLSRRAFLGQMSGVTVVTLATGGVGVALVSGTNNPLAHAADMVPEAIQDGCWQA